MAGSTFGLSRPLVTTARFYSQREIHSHDDLVRLRTVDAATFGPPLADVVLDMVMRLHSPGLGGIQAIKLREANRKAISHPVETITTVQLLAVVFLVLMLPLLAAVHFLVQGVVAVAQVQPRFNLVAGGDTLQ